MAWFFGDGFDLYNAGADMVNGYWDSSSLNPNSSGLIAGRFAGSRGLNPSNATVMHKVSGSNDAVHHFVVAFYQNGLIQTATGGVYFSLLDGATAQCTVLFRCDGAIELKSGAYNGTSLAVYTGAVTAGSTWFAFEIEVVIHNTSGSIAVRKNGNTTNDFFLGSLNTRPGANAYANKLQMGSASASIHWIDDFLWRSDATVPWVGDVRCYTRMPAIDTAKQWSPVGGRTVTLGGNNPATYSQDTVSYSPYTCPNCDGTIATVTISTATGVFGAGTYRAAIYADNGLGPGGPPLGAPTTLLGQSTTNPTNIYGSSTFAFGFATPVPVTAGQRIWVAIYVPGVNTGNTCIGFISGGWKNTVTSANFPQATPTSLVSTLTFPGSIVVTPTHNASLVNEAQQDASATYVYAPANGLADLYTIAPITITPATVLGVTTRGYMTKSDAGTRNAAVRVKSGATTVQTASVTLSPSGWSWISRTDTVDPATGVAWTAAGVNGINIGPVTTA